jgi:MoaA/NifB/PqqE/SkfB family radical SAM enzyme
MTQNNIRSCHLNNAMFGIWKNRLSDINRSMKLYPELLTPSFFGSNFARINLFRMRKSGEAPPVLNVDLKVTRRCNASCEFCLTETTKGNAPEMTAEELLKSIRSIGTEKKAFFITGGEPFLRPDIFKVVEGIKQRGSYAGIVTNGSLLNDAKLSKIASSGLSNIIFSLHGNDRVHNAVLGLKDARQKVLDSISSVRMRRGKHKGGHPFILVNSVIHKDARDMAGTAKDALKAGADAVRFSYPSFLYPSESANNRTAAIKLFGEAFENSQYIVQENHAHRGYVKGAAKRINRSSEVYTLPSLSADEETHWEEVPFRTRRSCMYIWTSTIIDEVGDVYPCQFHKYRMGNILKEDFADIWNNARYRRFRRAIGDGLLPGCARCCKLF